MLFTLIIFTVALMMEAIGSYISVIGLSSLFAGDVVILVMAVILDIAKVTSVSFLYKNWKDLKRAMKAYFLVAVIVLMTITSSGAFGYLSNAFQKAVQPNKELSLQLDASTSQIDVLTKELSDLAAQRSKLDAQVAAISPNMVTARKRLLTSFQPDYDRINSRTTTDQTQLDKLKADQLTLQTSNVDKEVHIGPIAYIAKAFDVTMDQASKYIIGVIISVFDPLAIMLILAGNFTLEAYRKAKKVIPDLSPPKSTGKPYDSTPDDAYDPAGPFDRWGNIAYDPTVMVEDPYIAPTAEQYERSRKAFADFNARETFDENQHELVIESPQEKLPISDEKVSDLVKLDHLEPIYEPIVLEKETPIFIPPAIKEPVQIVMADEVIVEEPKVEEITVVPEVEVIAEPLALEEPMQEELIYTGPLAIDGYATAGRTIFIPQFTIVDNDSEELLKRQSEIAAAEAIVKGQLNDMAALNARLDEESTNLLVVEEPTMVALEIELAPEPDVEPEIEAINIAIDSGEFTIDPEIMSKVIVTNEPEQVIVDAGKEISMQRAIYE